MRPIWAEVNLDKVRHNAEEIRRYVGDEVRIMAIVKANGYGHGAVPLSLEIKPVADMFGAAILEEALSLREAGIEKPILILGYTRREDNFLVVRHNLTQTIFSLEQAHELEKTAAEQNRRAKVHIKIDTGMNRLGFRDEEGTLEIIREIDALPHLEIEGIYSHIANGGCADLSYSRLQLRRYSRFMEAAEAALGRRVLKHLSNSATLVEFREAHFDMVRSGLMLYGSFSTAHENTRHLKLKKALTLKGILSQVKVVGAGEPVSYNGTFVTSRETRIGVLPLGYGDGFSRGFSNKAHVLIEGIRVPVIGNVCMDQLMLDLTELPEVRMGQEVIIYGEENPVEEFAELVGTISYELYCNISERIPRIYVRD